MINEHPCTIVWFVYNRNVSHMDASVNPTIVDKIEEHFGKLSQTTVKNHTFLGMYIGFVGGKKVAVSMPHQDDKDI